MPELPEVETIRRSLQSLVGEGITDTTLSAVAPLDGTTAAAFRRTVTGRTIAALQRHGKYLLFGLDTGDTVVIHLGMSGQLRFVDDATTPLAPHTHLRLRLASGRELRYIDARRFGTLSLDRHIASTNPLLARLGPDYLDESFDATQFIARCRRHAGLTLKGVTLHQGIAAGLGNIYACEALYAAALSPTRTVRATPDDALATLFQAARRALHTGIAHGGTTLRDYLDGHGARGAMQHFLQVYGREGQRTLDGRGTVTRIVQQGRSTWYSPEVQRS